MINPYILPGIIKNDGAYSISRICDAVAVAFKIPEELLKQTSRRRDVCFPRQVAVYLAIKYSGKTTVEIGRYFRQDHSTVIYSNKKIHDYLATNQFVDQINTVEALLRNSLNSD